MLYVVDVSVKHTSIVQLTVESKSSSGFDVKVQGYRQTQGHQQQSAHPEHAGHVQTFAASVLLEHVLKCWVEGW